MATFEAQVEAMTSIAIDGTSTPTQDELSQYLKDGVIDVTNKWLLVKPQDADKFARSTTSDSQGVSVGGAEILHVMREANADGSSDGTSVWRSCRKIPLALQSRVVDSDSLLKATIYNPVYTQEVDKTINVYPTPSSNNAIKVYYINEEPRDITNNAALVYSHSNIKYFPNHLVYLVVKYAAIKVVEAKISSYTVDEEDSELVASYANTYRALKTEYDQTFGMVAKSIMESGNQQQVLEQRGQMPTQGQEGEE